MRVSILSLLLLVVSMLPLVVASGSMHYYADRLARTKEFIAKFEREHPTDDNNNNNNEHVSEKKSSTTNNKSDRYEQFQAMRSKIQKVKASVPSMNDEHLLIAKADNTSSTLYSQDTSSKNADSHYQEDESSLNTKDTTTTTKEDASQQRALNYKARYENMQTFVSGLQTLDLRTSDTSNENMDSDVLRLTLSKPLGIILDGQHQDQAIVLSLDNERPGAAHELSKDIQDNLVGRQITRVNDENVADLSLMKVAERIMEADSPVDLELTTVEEHNVDRDNLLSLTLSKPLGIILNADIEDEAIVFSLDDEYPGAAHELSEHVQKKLVGSRIVTVNHEDVSELSLMEVAKRIVASDSPVQLEFETVEERNDNNVLHLTMDRPFGFILDADVEEKAIVLSLDDEYYPGSAHALSKQVQQQLVGRHIVTVNNEDVSDLSLMAVAERMVNADSPVKLEFAIVEDEMDEGYDEDEAKTIDYYDDYLKELVAPGQLSLLKWKDDRKVIDPYAALVGLPAKLVPTIQAYASRLGIIEKLKDILYNSPCEPESGRFYKTENPHFINSEFPFLSQLNDREELSWYVQRPGMHWHSDMHWFAPSDENSHEFKVQMLMQGGFGQVLEGIGTHYNLEGLFIQSVGFLGVTHCEEGFLHDDFKDVDGKFFNLLLPVCSPKGAGEELNVAGERYGTDIVGTKIKYDPAFGVLVGDRALHGTREVDHRPREEIRVVLSIYLADLTESNIDNVSSDDTAIFPVPGATDWLWAQRGRHWRKDQCVVSDTGRQPFKAEDKSLGCSDMARRGDCESDAKFARTYCPQSCKVYMDDEEYQPGVERRDVMGDLDLVVA